jgi:hypothetical protein
VVSHDDVVRLIAELPGVDEGERYGNHTWKVGKKSFAWDRPFTKADIKRFGDRTPPSGPILAVAVEDLSEKEATLAEHPDAVFDMEHFYGYPAVLVQLDVVDEDALRQLLLDGWLAAAPADLARRHLDELGLGD